MEQGTLTSTDKRINAADRVADIHRCASEAPEDRDHETNGKLFMICPDCDIEQAIRSHFDCRTYFITALGAVFAPLDTGFTGMLNTLLSIEQVDEILIAVDPSCRFLQGITGQGPAYNTRAEGYFQDSLAMRAHLLNGTSDSTEKNIELARLAMTRQMREFTLDPNIGPRLASGEISIKSVLYNRTTDEFSPM